MDVDKMKLPEGITSDYYHNKAMDIRYDMREIKRQKKIIDAKLERMQRDFDMYISARDHAKRQGV
jgi:hypothetical protein